MPVIHISRQEGVIITYIKYIFIVIILGVLAMPYYFESAPQAKELQAKSLDSSIIEEILSVRIEREHFLIDFETKAKAAFLLNADTGQTLYAKNPDELLPIASMSKLMTEHLVLQAIKKGNLEWEEEVTISRRAAGISNTPGFSSVYLHQGENYTIRELFEAAAIRSGNGAAVALAEAVAGSEEKFVELMNQEAAHLGLTNAVFYNSTGLTNGDLGTFQLKGDPDNSNSMSARDLAALAETILDNSPEILEVSSMAADSITHDDGTTYRYKNTNLLLASQKGSPFRYSGVDGLKTGYTTAAGYSLVGTLQQEKNRYISVLIGTSSSKERFTGTTAMYERIRP